MITVFMTVLIACLMLLDFFGANVTDGYVAENSEYGDEYLKVASSYIKSGKGYVSLSRILYFYLEDDTLSFNEIYEDNLDKELKQVKPISEVCEMSKYKNMSICDKNEYMDSGQIDEIQLKPFSYPIDFSKVTVTSFFKQERIVYGKSDVHDAWDLASANETPVLSVCDGEVIKVSFPYKENSIDTSDKVGGNHIKIKCSIDDDTSYIVYYAHLYPNSNKVKVGDIVKSGQQIAGVGTTGYSTGPHLHYAVQTEDGTRIDGMSLVDFSENNKLSFNNNNPSFGY